MGTDQKLAAGIWELTRVGPPLFGHNCPIDKSTISIFTKPISQNDDLKFKLNRDKNFPTKKLGNLGVELNP